MNRFLFESLMCIAQDWFFFCSISYYYLLLLFVKGDFICMIEYMKLIIKAIELIYEKDYRGLVILVIMLLEFFYLSYWIQQQICIEYKVNPSLSSVIELDAIHMCI